MECVPGRVGTRPSSTTETLEAPATNSGEDISVGFPSPAKSRRIAQDATQVDDEEDEEQSNVERISQRWNEEQRIPCCRFVANQATALTIARKTQLWERAHAGSGTSA